MRIARALLRHKLQKPTITHQGGDKEGLVQGWMTLYQPVVRTGFSLGLRISPWYLFERRLTLTTGCTVSEPFSV